MKKRMLGKSGIQVNPVGLGCMGFSHAYGHAMDEQEAISILRQSQDVGYDFFDTAEVYKGKLADGTLSWNEEVVGKALAPVRQQVVIATKMGIRIEPDQSLSTDARPEVIRKSLEGSLKRLGTDYVDLYYQHRIDPAVEPEVVADTMAKLIREGKIRAWGISEANEEYLRRVNAVCPVAAIQNRYSMMARWHENLFPVCEELGVSFVAFSPLANGFLTGKYTKTGQFTDKKDYRSKMPQFTAEGEEKGKQFLQLLQELGEQKKASVGQLSLAWMLCKKTYIIPIPGSRKISRLKENFSALQVFLSPGEIEQLDRALDRMELPVFGGSKIASK